MASLSALYDQAFEALEQALALDKKAQAQEEGRGTEEAIGQYETALRLFDACHARETEASKRVLLETKTREYGQRLGALKERLGDARWAQAKALDNKPDGSGDAASDKVATAYLGAVENYLGALKLKGEGNGGDVSLRKRVQQILDRVEELKGGRKQQQPATSVDLLDLPLPPSSPLPSVTATATAAAPAAPPMPPPRPRSATDLTATEIEVLKVSSTINGRTFVPWMDGEELRERFTYSTDKPFTDPEGLLPLSAKQAARLGGWKRPREFITGGQTPRMITKISPYSIEQDAVGDCSFIASLCISAAFEAKYNTKLITKLIYPQDANGTPVYNPGGKYLVKLWANGCLRKVVVDDLLPVDKQGELLCASSSDTSELWVSIIEKAAMKLHGSYDWPGSNSGCDMYMLTGWIPEQVFWEDGAEEKGKGGGKGLDHRQSAERAWERLKSASELGDCLTTVATSALGEAEAEALGLVPTHAYAVLAVKEVLGGQRFLLLKNPWRRKAWHGPYCAADQARWTPALCQALGYDPRAAQRADDGVFWVSWADVRRYFGSIFLNWRPGLFAHRTVTHALWPQSQGPRNDMFSYAQNPQYILRVDKAAGPTRDPASVWLLLSRHVTQSRDEKGDGAGEEGGDYLTLHVYKVQGEEGQRIVYPSDDSAPGFVRGLYSNNPHGLVRLDVEAGDPGRYALVLSQYEKKRDVRYSLTVLSTAPFVLRPTRPLPGLVARIEGSWTDRTAGGRLGLATFLHNPQFTVVVVKPCALHVELLAPKEMFVGFSLIGGRRGGKRVDSVLQGEEVLTSGAYRQGFCYAAAAAPTEPGTYTLVVSTYEAGLKGNFLVNFHGEGGEGAVQTSVLLPEGDGMLCTVLTGAWQGKLTGGCSPPAYASQNPTFFVQVKERTRLLMRLVAHENEPINVSLFELTGADGGAPRLPSHSTFPGCPSTLATSHSAIFTASRCGVLTPTVDLTTGRTYAAVVACYSAGVESAFTLTVFSSSAVGIRRVL